MADKTSIEWTATINADGTVTPGATWNPITGCAVVSRGCTNCYAMRLAGTRLKDIPSRAGLTTMSKAGPVWNGKVRLNEEWLDQPLKWKRPRRIFVCAHGDLFAENVPDEWIDRVFAVMALAPQHTFQVLTKRAKRMREYVARLDQEPERDTIRRMAAAMPEPWPKFKEIVFPSPNVWLGVSAEDQTRADERIPDLLATPSAIRFVSAEPLLGALDLSEWLRPACARCPPWETPCRHRCEHVTSLNWVIVGGESGPGARAMHPDWVRSIRDQCASARVAFFMKQWGAWLPGNVYSKNGFVGFARHQDGSDGAHGGKPDHWWSGNSFDGVISTLVGKKAAGRLLDGVEHSAFPELPRVGVGA